MSTDPSAIGELIRRAQLARQLSTVSPQIQAPQEQNSTSQDQLPPLYNTIQNLNPQLPSLRNPQIDNRDRALSDYRQALQTPEPSQKDYHPSLLRTIGGAFLGGIAGMRDPKSGFEIGRGVAYGPYQQQLTDYQKRLAQKKEAYETEESALSDQSKLSEQESQKEAEVQRGKAQEALREEELGKQRSLIPGTPEFEGERQKLQIQHPNVPKLPSLFKVPLNNGESVIAIQDPKTNQFIEYGTDTPLGDKTYDASKITKLGTTNPKETPEKPPREGEAGAIDQWTQEHGRAPNYSERINIHRQFADKPQSSDTSEFRLQSAKESAARNYQRNFDLASSQLSRIENSIREVDSFKPSDLAIAIPTILTALVSGQGTGVRITKDEMNRLISARGWGDSVEAMVNKISGLGDLSNKQKSDLKGLLTDVQNKVSEKQGNYSDTIEEIYNANKLDDINQARIKSLKKESNSSNQINNNKIKDPLGILGGK